MGIKAIFRRLYRLVQLMGVWQTMKFLGAFALGRPLIQLRVNGATQPVFARPRSSDAFVLRQVFGLRECDVPVPQPVQLIVDAGANNGYTALFLKQLHPRAAIIGIEPDSANCELFRMNTRGLEGVRLVQGALWHREAWLKIENPDDDEWAFRVVECQEQPGAMRGYTLEQLLRESGFSEIALLKMDIEGAEVEVFTHGLEKWIDSVRVLVVETHGPAANDLVQRTMASRGFTHEASGEKHVFTRVSQPTPA